MSAAIMDPGAARELAVRLERSPILAKLVDMNDSGWFRFGRKARDTVQKVMLSVPGVSAVEVLNELDWMRKRGLLGARPSPDALRD